MAAFEGADERQLRTLPHTDPSAHRLCDVRDLRRPYRRRGRLTEAVTVSEPASPRPASALAEVLEVQLRDPGLLDLALTHRSWAFEHGLSANNERLEFLGDAVLGLVVTDEVYRRHHDEPEGRLAKLRAAAVKTASLAAVARSIELGSFLRLGRGEAASGGADKPSLLADGLEAVFGAIYVDLGIDVARAVIAKLMAPRLDAVAEIGAALDFKTSLQELAAARFSSVPRYEVSGVGPDHAKTFTAAVAIDGHTYGVGTGRSKKQAEQRAAAAAWQILDDDQGSDPAEAGAV